MGDALVIAAHGSHLSPASAAPTLDHADAIRATGAFCEVREAFWKGEPSLREVLRTLESETVSVVPLFMAGGYFTRRVVPRELRLVEGASLDVEKEVSYAEPVGTHGAMADVIVARAESVTGDPGVGESVGLAVVGHGTERHESSGESTRRHAERIRATGRFDEVRALFMDEEPRIDGLTGAFESRKIVVVPLFVADGHHTTEDIPRRIGIAAGDRTGYESPASVDGRRVWYAGAVGTEPLLADVIVERAVEVGADVDPALARPTRPEVHDP